MNWSLAVIALVICAVLAQPLADASLLSLLFDDNGEELNLASIEPETGNVTFIGPGLATVGAVSGEQSFDPISQQLYFLGQAVDDPARRLFALDVRTGAILASPEVQTSPPLVLVHFDPGRHMLVGLRFQDDLAEFIEIDPVTGNVTRIGDGLPTVAKVGVGAFDPMTRRYYFFGERMGDARKRIMTVDAPSGELLSDPLLSRPLPNTHIHFDPATSSLLMFRGIPDETVPDEGIELLDSIDPKTGEISTVLSFPRRFQGIGARAYDPLERSLLMQASLLGDSAWRIATLNIEQGAFTSEPALPFSRSLLMHWNSEAPVVPEPRSSALLLFGILGLAGLGGKRRSRGVRCQLPR